MKEKPPSQLTLAVRGWLREPATVDTRDHAWIKRWARMAAQHCAALATLPGDGARRRRRLWALYHLALCATVCAVDAFNSGDADGCEAWRESGRRAVDEIDAVRDEVTP
jgi:hypothetical protein